MPAYSGRKLAEIIGACTLLAFALFVYLYLFPNQIPKGLPGDLDSAQYPTAIMIVWILSVIAWLATALSSNVSAESIEGGTPGRKSLLIAVTVLMGFLLFHLVGFIIAAIPTIIILSFICGERGVTPFILGIIVPPAVYVFLLKVMEVRLPSVIPL